MPWFLQNLISKFNFEYVIELNIRSSLPNSKVINLEIHVDDKESIYRHNHIKNICDFEILFIWPFRSTGKHHLTYELLFSNYIFIARCFCANQKVITHDLIDLSKFGKNTHTVHSKKETGLNGSLLGRVKIKDWHKNNTLRFIVIYHFKSLNHMTN